jgi:FKBP-type peptidyl-prolyl cis-trans isomerase
MAAAGCNGGGPAKEVSPDGKAAQNSGASTQPEVGKTDTVVGTGLVAEAGDTAEVEYSGSLTTGEVFDANDQTSKPGAKPFAFTIGAGMVIKGWDLGVAGMKVGGVRKLHIPYQLAYGDKGQPPKIPPKADLEFRVTLLGLVKKGEGAVYDQPKDLKVGTGAAVKDGDWVTIQVKGDYLNKVPFAQEQTYEFQTITGLMKGGQKMGVIGLRYIVQGMKVGGVREAVLPPEIAYSANSAETETGMANNSIKYTVTLLKFKPGTLPKKDKS